MSEQTQTVSVVIRGGDKPAAETQGWHLSQTLEGQAEMAGFTAGVNQYLRLLCNGILAQLISFHNQEDNLAYAHSEILWLWP